MILPRFAFIMCLRIGHWPQAHAQIHIFIVQTSSEHCCRSPNNFHGGLHSNYTVQLFPLKHLITDYSHPHPHPHHRLFIITHVHLCKVWCVPLPPTSRVLHSVRIEAKIKPRNPFQQPSAYQIDFGIRQPIWALLTILSWYR